MSRIARAAAVAAATWLAAGAPAARAEQAKTDVDACAEAGAGAWKALESGGGVVPEIDEDRTQAPPGWWRYPGPRRSAEILAAEAKAPDGLYERVQPDDLKEGDVVVRATGAGACGKMAVVAGQLEGRWMLQDATEKDGAAKVSDDALFMGSSVGGARLRPEAVAYRVRVKADTTQGHVREIGRDLAHLERTIAERPALVAPKGLGAVSAKVQDLVDEAWSLGLDPTADLPRRELTGRALAVAGTLDDWPGAAESAAAVLDDLLARVPDQPHAIVARASLFLADGQPERALPLAQKAVTVPRAPARARYVLARALLATGKQAEGMAALRRYLDDEPGDPRANQLAATAGKKPALAPSPKADADLRFASTSEHAGASSTSYGFKVDWPMPWRVVHLSDSPDAGLLLSFLTGRVFDDQGAPGRGSVTLVAQRPKGSGDRAAIAKRVADEIVAGAKVKPLPPLVPGSQHQSFHVKVPKEGVRLGELTTIERAGVVYVLVLEAQPGAYPKLKEQYAELVRSLRFSAAASKPSP